MRRIIVRLKGGLGNQLFQFARGYSLAIENGADLYLDRSYFYHDARHGGVMLRDWTLPDSVRDVSIGSIASWLLRVDEKLGHVCSRCFDVGLIAEKGRTSSRAGTVILDGYWQDARFFDRHTSALRAFMHPAVDLSSEAILLNERIERVSGAVSLHVRRGDYVTDSAAQQVHGVLGLDYYERAVQYVLKHVAEPRFFVFSDDIEWAESSLSLPGQVEFVRLPDTSPVVDMYLMSRCAHNVIANSTFSWWGAWLNASPDKIVIAPKAWFSDPVMNSRTAIVPSEWVRL